MIITLDASAAVELVMGRPREQAVAYLITMTKSWGITTKPIR